MMIKNKNVIASAQSSQNESMMGKSCLICMLHLLHTDWILMKFGIDKSILAAVGQI
jgi:hypothetical protein